MSATLGWPADVESTISSQSNHRQMVKFPNEQDPRYVQLLGPLKNMVEEAMKGRKS
jgi:hypothetical protein